MDITFIFKTWVTIITDVIDCVKIGVGWEEIKIDCAINKNFQLTNKRKEKARKLLYFCIIIDIIFPGGHLGRISY